MPRSKKRREPRERPDLKYRLTYRKRMRIGARAEELWGLEYNKSKSAALAETNSLVQEQWKKARGLSITERAAWLAGEPKVIEASGTALNFEEYQGDVRAALQEQQGINDADDDSEPGRVITITHKRPYGKPDRIYRLVAREFRKYGVSPRIVDRCHKGFRRMQKATTD